MAPRSDGRARMLLRLRAIFLLVSIRRIWLQMVLPHLVEQSRTRYSEEVSSFSLISTGITEGRGQVAAFGCRKRVRLLPGTQRTAQRGQVELWPSQVDHY